MEDYNPVLNIRDDLRWNLGNKDHLAGAYHNERMKRETSRVDRRSCHGNVNTNTNPGFHGNENPGCHGNENQGCHGNENPGCRGNENPGCYRNENPDCHEDRVGKKLERKVGNKRVVFRLDHS